MFLQCTDGSALYPTKCWTGLVLLVINLELCLKSQEEKWGGSKKLSIHSQKLLFSVSVSSSGSSTRTGVPLFGMALEVGLSKVLFIMIDAEHEDLCCQRGIGTVEFL